MLDNLELLPMYILALMKNVAFRGETYVNPEERITAQLLWDVKQVICTRQ